MLLDASAMNLETLSRLIRRIVRFWLRLGADVLRSHKGVSNTSLFPLPLLALEVESRIAGIGAFSQGVVDVNSLVNGSSNNAPCV